jgi:hypothetical protein
MKTVVTCIMVGLTATVAVVGAVTKDNVPPPTVDVEGKLVRVADVLKKRHGVTLDAASAKTLLAIEQKDGAFVPLLHTAGARMLLGEKRLLGRTLRLTGRRYKGLDMLDVIATRTVKDGVLHDVHYFCETCVISVYRPGRCPCCPDEVVLREVPVVK